MENWRHLRCLQHLTPASLRMSQWGQRQMETAGPEALQPALRVEQLFLRGAGLLGWGDREQEASQWAALEVMRKENWCIFRILSDWFLSSTQNQHPSMGLSLWQRVIYFSSFHFMVSHPPFPFSLSCNYPCPILTKLLVKTMTEIFPGQTNSIFCRSALSYGRFAVLFGYQQSVMINRAEDRNTEPFSHTNIFLRYLHVKTCLFQIM